MQLDVIADADFPQPIGRRSDAAPDAAKHDADAGDEGGVIGVAFKAWLGTS
jgi:hypothetical protein